MNLGITSIQRNRGPWIVEWLAFHMLVGFNRFYIYAHKTDDGMTQTLLKLARHYPIAVHALDTDAQPQLAAYRHAWAQYGQAVDWMAFIDGDEFLFSPAQEQLAQALAPYQDQPLSALGAYWVCYGGNGHVEEPAGLVMQNYPRHSAPGFLPNRHVKSLVRGGERIDIQASHVFDTPRGTFDERLRPLRHGFVPELAPSCEVLRINHYAVQSWEFFKQTKQNMGAADGSPALVRPDSWYRQYDRNDCDDGVSHNFLIPLKLKVRELQAALAAA
ncbi:glycosyltransferase family 2 protein [Azohydromonas aeria]|uniref:glycosyltransferase family 2 protein n=1 Tax=Azohydromonas aeria TaxID=2590212 RepID=UPI0012FC20E2|nr:glycosyltransferase family 2 protein [Azohydromonas aeria]